MFRRLAAIGSLFLLVCIVGTWDNPPAEAARWVFVPHNCAEWEPIDHAERKTAILETLGVHRGQTLYCGIDQSDTFTAAEVFEAGKDHNQRDDTVYWGENGNFFGFTACQAGWLTDGEEGLTGCSTAAIFEFPRERVRDRDSGRRLSLRYGRHYESDGTVIATGANGVEAASSKYGSAAGGGERVKRGGQHYRLRTYVNTEWVGTRRFRANYVASDTSIERHTSKADAVAAARAYFADAYATPESIKERARVGSVGTRSIDAASGGVEEISPIFIGADAECRELGYKQARNINAWFAPESDAAQVSDYLETKVEQGDAGSHRASYRRQIYYEAVCWSP